MSTYKHSNQLWLPLARAIATHTLWLHLGINSPLFIYLWGFDSGTAEEAETA